MKNKIIVILISLLSVQGFAQTTESLDPLVKSYINAINTKNTNALRELVYPACRTNLTASEETQLKNRLDTDLNLVIPENAKVKVSDYAGYGLYGDAAIWKVRPTREIEIRYRVGEGGKLMNRFAAQADGKWYFVLPYVDMKKLEKQPTSKELTPLRDEEKVPPSSPAPPLPPGDPDKNAKKDRE